MISNLFITSSFFALMSVVGASIWSSSNDIFTLTSIYEFHWGVSVTSLVLSILFYSIHTFNFILDYVRIIGNINLVYIHLPTITLLCALYMIFWISASISLSYTVTECNYYELSCIGEIISMVFGYLNFFIWTIIFYIGFSKWASRYQNSTDHNQINLETIEGQSEQPEVPVKDEPEVEVKDEPYVPLDVEEVGQLDGGPGTYPETDEFEQPQAEVEAEVQSYSDTVTQNN
jgi:hypothetical protein